MRAFTDDELIKRVEGLPSFEGWKKGQYDIYVRSAADAFDLFDDKAFTYDVKSDGAVPSFIMVRNCTTNAGSYYLKTKLENPLGCAVLKSDFIMYGSHVFGYHKHIANLDHEAYVEARGFPYHRDNNRNEKAEEIGPEYTNLIGANIHHAGVNSAVIKNWSAGCLVTATRSKFDQFLDFMKSKGKLPLNVAILKEFPLKGK